MMKAFLILLVSALALSAEVSLRPAEQALQVKQFDKTVTLLDNYLADDEAKQPDYAIYLKALALQHQDENEAALKACEEMLKRFPGSPWRRKALFLQSGILVEKKRFEEAEAIYEAEANRLFSADRKKGLAQVLIDFGDELARQPGDHEIDAPPPDFNKAIQLYQKALEMEIAREVRDGVRFKLARCWQELSNWGEAENRYREYLAEFDPKWAGPVGSPERFRGQLRENPPPAGAHWKEARFHLVEVQLAQAGQQIQIVAGRKHQALQVQPDATPHLPKLQMARQNAEDLLTLLGKADDALRSDTGWLLVRSYNLPHPAAGELDRGIQQARDFLKLHPKHPRATDTSRLIALTFRNVGRTDDAIAAYADFAREANFTFVPEDGEPDPAIKTGRSCKDTFDAWTREAVFAIGQLRFEQKQYDAAIQQWREYIARFPNGAQWSDCQSGIINAQFQVGLDAVEAKDYGRAREHFDQFLKDHPLDGRARQILFTLGQIDYVLAQELEEVHETPDEDTAAKIEDHYRKAIEQWERLVSKYPNTEESSLALYRIGVVQEEKLGELDQALATYQRLNWGSSAGQAQQRFQTLTTHSLSLRTERTFRTNEDAYVEVTSRNAPKLTFRQYHLNLEAYFRKTHGIGGVEDLDIDLIEPDKTWEVEVEDYEKYKPITQRIKVPFEGDQPGVCVIKVSEEDFEAATMVIRSDIEIITKTSRRELLVFAQNRVTGKPASGVSVIASNGTEVFGSGETGEDGVFRRNFFDTLRDASGVGVFASGKRGIASCNLGLQNLNFSSGLAPRGYVYTDKPTYRPGEEVNIRGILRGVVKGSYAVPEHKSYHVRVFDPKERMLQENIVELDEFGAFDSAAIIDDQAPLGTYTVKVSAKDAPNPTTFSGSFQVQRYKLEKVKLAFDFPKKVIFRGETIEATLKASYYWGAPAAGETIDYTLPDGRTYSEQTDDDGIIRIDYDPSGFLPGSHLNFTALAKGYNVGTADHVFLAKLGFSTTVKPAQEIALAGEPVDVELKTVDAEGKPIGRDLTLYVLRREQPQPDKILSAVPWIQRATQAAAEVTVEEIKVTTDADSGLGTARLTLKKGGLYVLRASGQDRFGQVVTAENTLTVSDDEDAVKLRFFADSSTGKVGAKLPVRLHSRLAESLALLTFEGEEILSHRVVTLKPGYNPIDLTPGHEHFPNFRLSVAAIDGRELRSAEKDFTIERELKVSVTPRNPVEAPGVETTVDVVVTDQNGKPVRAALGMSLVNEALYALYPESVPSILDFFQSVARRNAEFRLASTCGFAYVGQTRAVVKSITEEKERLERRQQEIVQLEKLRQEGGYGLGNDMFARVPGGMRGAALDQSALNEPAPTVPGEVAAMSQLEAQAELKDLDFKKLERDLSLGGRADKPADTPAKPRKEVMAASRWVSPIITGADGKAEVKIPLPDSTTEWRLTARGCTVETLVGQATASLITRKDFFLELKTPVFAQEGDTMRLLAKLHNLTDFEGKVEVSLNLKGGERSKQSRRIDVKAHSVSDCVFDEIIIPLTKTVTLTAKTRAGKLADTLVVDLPVRPWGMELGSSAGGVADGNADAVIALPKDQELIRRELEITLSPSVRQALLDYALGGSGSSQADALLAAVSALDYATAHDAPEKDIRTLRDRARSLAAALTATQQDDGQWPWNGSADLYQTCRTYWALGLAREAGIAIQPDFFARTEKALADQFAKLGSGDNDNKSLILHALSVTGKADFAHLNRIYRERAKLSNNALARTAVAMINLDRPDFARDLVEQLEKSAKLDDPKVAWWEGGGTTVLQDRNETTAMVLLALAGVKPDSPLAARAADLLLRDRGQLCRISPQALGSAVVALAAYYEKMDDAKSDFEITVVVNGDQVATLKSADIGRSTTIPVPAKLIKDGDNIIRFEKQGPGRYAWSAVLTAFSPELNNPNAWTHHLHFTGDSYFHDNLIYRGVPLKSASTSPVTKVEVGQKIRAISRVSNSYSDAQRYYRVREEYLPAGMLLVEGSLSGNFQHHEIGDGVITMYYRPGVGIGDISYELVGYAPGTYRVLPGTIRDFYHRQRLTTSKARTITVLAPGEESDDPYQLNRHERFELANLNFNDGNFEAALGHLQYLFEHERDHYERDLARMLLWIHTMEGYFDAPKVVQMFEILRERHPDLTIPFDKILVVGRAYRVIGEHERAWLVFRATIDSSFIHDASLSATLEDQGQFLGGIDYMDRIWREYPDTAEVVSSYFALSQQLYEKAPKAHELQAEQERRKRRLGKEAETFDRIGLLKASLEHLHRFLTHYPTDPLADDAAFSMANAYFALEDYPTVVKAAEGFQKVYPDSSFVTSFQYMAALGHFWQYHYDEALASAKPVTESDSKDRDYARYITAQIHHALGTPAKAITWYEKVRTLYPDAAEAIAYFEEEKIEMDEVTTFKPGEKAEIELRFRNIQEAYLQIYKVDLMKLYLREKNLSNITKVHLAGIEPEFEMTLDLGDGKDYRDRERMATLPLKDEGAYLVICRGDDLFTSGMVLVTPLKLEIQEAPSAGSLRVNVRDTVDDGYQAKVHVKAIGSQDDGFKSGDTDLRGIFVAEGLTGAATVIARQDGRYAFYRGTTPLGNVMPDQRSAPAQPQLRQQLQQSDYLNNLFESNSGIQRMNIDGWESLRRGKGGKGVEVQQAK